MRGRRRALAGALVLVCGIAARSGPESRGQESDPESPGPETPRAELVLLHETVTRLAAFTSKEKGVANPFARLLKDGDLDPDALLKLVQDYKKARAAAPFARYPGKLPLAAPPRDDPESEAVRSLDAIVLTRAITRGEGKRAGYSFVVVPSPSSPERFYVKATPEKEGLLHFFTNQTGKVYSSSVPFAADDESCAVPGGLTPVVGTSR